MTSQIVYLVSLNKTPARAVTLIEDVLARLKLPVNIVHVANSATLDVLEILLKSIVKTPEILICSSQWTAVEQEQANSIARSVLPDITLVNIPPGLDLREGGSGIIKFLETAIGGYCEQALSYLPVSVTDGVRSALDTV